MHSFLLSLRAAVMMLVLECSRSECLDVWAQELRVWARLA